MKLYILMTLALLTYHHLKKIEVTFDFKYRYRQSEFETSLIFKGINRERYVYDWFRLELSYKDRSYLFRLFETHSNWYALC